MSTAPTDAAGEARRSAAVVCAGVAAFVLGYLSVSLFHPSSLLYDPAHRVWRVGRHPTGLWMAYYGQVAYGLAGGAAAMLVTGLATRRRAPGLSATRVLFALALAAIAVGVVFYGASTMGRWL